MDLRTMKYVLAIAEHQNLTKAADALHVGQPTLSKFLSALENELGLKLFRKVGHRFLLTDAGECYVEKASRILILETELETEIADLRKRDAGDLKVSFANMRSSYMLPRILPVYERLHPNVKVHLFEDNSDENDRRLISGQIEAAFYSKPGNPNPLIEYIPLSKEELLICCAAGHPLRHLAKPAAPGGVPGSPALSLDLTALTGERVLMMQPGQRTRQIVDEILHENRISFPDVLYLSNIHAIMGLAAAGYGVSFVFDTHLRNRNPAAPLDCYRIAQGPVIGEFVAAVRKGSYLSRYLLDFIEITKNKAGDFS